MKATRREFFGKAVRWTFVGTVAASLLEGTGGVDPITGRCDCLYCRLDRALSPSGDAKSKAGTLK